MSASARSAVISLMTKTACSFSSAKERRSPVSSRKRTIARRPLVRPLASSSAPTVARTAMLESLALAAELVGCGFELRGAFRAEPVGEGEERILARTGAPTRSGRPPKICGAPTAVSQTMVRWSSASSSASARSSAERSATISRLAAATRSSRRARRSKPKATSAASAVPAVTAHQIECRAPRRARQARVRKALRLRGRERAPSARASPKRSAAPRPSMRTGYPFRARLRHPPRRIRAASARTNQSNLPAPPEAEKARPELAAKMETNC